MRVAGITDYVKWCVRPHFGLELLSEDLKFAIIG